MKTFTYGSRIVSLLMLLTLMRYWSIPVIQFRLAFQQPDLSTGWFVFHMTVGILFVLLNLMSALGLFFLKKWGTMAGCLAIIFTTVFFSISYFPLTDKFFPPLIVILINTAVLLYLIYLNTLRRKP